MATTTLYPSAWHLLLAHPLLLDHLPGWEHAVPLFDEGMANGQFGIQDYGLDMDVTESQLAHSHPHLPQIDWGSNQESPLPFHNQVTIPVSIFMHPQLA